jgi:predicted amidohydrolase YtcJ
MRMKWLSFFFLVLLSSCSQKGSVDLILYNATIYTVDSNFTIAEAIAVRNGKIVAVGKTSDLKNKYEAKETTDAEGKFVYPGFIDAHCHFYRYSLGLNTLDLTGTTSWEEIVEKLKLFSSFKREGWLIGRGWDQNDWTVKEFPTKEKLDERFPDRPVVLTRIDGHAAIANQLALDLAGVKAGDKLTGGEVETKAGKLTGILIDNASDKVYNTIPAANGKEITDALMLGQKNCFETGLTTVDDCGVDYQEVLLMDSLQKRGDLKMRVFAMLSDNKKNYDFLFSKGRIKTERLNVSAFKVYADGALGSRGACLLAPYSDKPGHYGFLLSDPRHFDSVAQVIYEKGFQMCTHAIGDSGNRVVLNIYAKYLKEKTRPALEN